MQLSLLKKHFIGALALVTFSSFSVAAAVDTEAVESITKKLSSLEIAVTEINPSVVYGLF